MIICFAAGLVRGFTGFALSAFGLALAVLIIPPVELIPVMWWLEMAASVVMLRHGWGGADMKAAATLVVGSTFGLIIGLNITTNVDAELSQRVALCLLISLAVLQLAKIRIPHLASRPGTIATGVLAGLPQGLRALVAWSWPYTFSPATMNPRKCVPHWLPSSLSALRHQC